MPAPPPNISAKPRHCRPATSRLVLIKWDYKTRIWGIYPNSITELRLWWRGWRAIPNKILRQLRSLAFWFGHSFISTQWIQKLRNINRKRTNDIIVQLSRNITAFIVKSYCIFIFKLIIIRIIWFIKEIADLLIKKDLNLKVRYKTFDFPRKFNLF